MLKYLALFSIALIIFTSGCITGELTGYKQEVIQLSCGDEVAYELMENDSIINTLYYWKSPTKQEYRQITGYEHPWDYYQFIVVYSCSYSVKQCEFRVSPQVAIQRLTSDVSPKKWYIQDGTEYYIYEKVNGKYTRAIGNENVNYEIINGNLIKKSQQNQQITGEAIQKQETIFTKYIYPVLKSLIDSIKKIFTR